MEGKLGLRSLREAHQGTSLYSMSPTGELLRAEEAAPVWLRSIEDRARPTSAVVTTVESGAYQFDMAYA